jgi:hypothetical protein
MVSPAKAEEAPDILKRFLQHPDKHFPSFFELCYRLTRGYLHYLKRRGVRLPVDQWAGKQPWNDLILDILGPFLRSTSQQPYVVVFDYFKETISTDFDKTGDDELYDLFKTLLFGYVKQELRRITHELNPQIENLKRRFSEILEGPLYTTHSSTEEYICLADDGIDLREDLPVISYEQLMGIVEEAYCLSFKRSEWCRKVFEKINDLMTVRNCIRKRDLIRAAVVTNSRYAEAHNVPVYSHTKTDNQLQLGAIMKAKQQTLDWVRVNILDRFVQKKQLTSETAEKFRSAADMYLTDFIYSSETDKLPEYFRAVMPPDEHPRYLKEFKYCFETTLNEAKDGFVKRVKNIL